MHLATNYGRHFLLWLLVGPFLLFKLECETAGRICKCRDCASLHGLLYFKAICQLVITKKHHTIRHENSYLYINSCWRIKCFSRGHKSDAKCSTYLVRTYVIPCALACSFSFHASWLCANENTWAIIFVAQTSNYWIYGFNETLLFMGAEVDRGTIPAVNCLFVSFYPNIISGHK